MKNKPIFNWDEEAGIASCILSDGEKVYTGFAQCHPDDEDMKGQKTGCEIAFRRARISALRGYRDELKIRLAALKQLYYSMNISHRFNEKSYENKMLQRQIRMTDFDLTTTKEMIATEEKNLRAYIKEKDEFYNKTRKRRAMREEKANNN